jgi:hypothetical protein
MIAECTPGFGHVRLQSNRGAQRCDRTFARTRVAVREPEFAVRRCPPRLRPHQRCEDVYCVCRATGEPVGGAKDEEGARLARDGFQDFERLLGGEFGLSKKEAVGVRQGRLERPHGFWPARHPLIPCFDTTTAQ